MSANYNPRPTGRKPRPKKPKPDFPLRIHKGTGYWCKKVHGRVFYFGKVADDPNGQAALEQWLEQKDDLKAGREPRPKTEGLTIAELCNLFLELKESLRDNRELSPRTFRGYYDTCETVVNILQRENSGSSATSDRKTCQLRKKLAETRGAVASAMKCNASEACLNMLSIRI